MLGTDLVSELRARGHECVAPTRAELDITNPESAAAVALGEFSGDWCFNCAAYTAVDKAESEPQLAYEINALGAAYLAKACAASGLRLLHVSTDFVFDGQAEAPYTEESPTNPLGTYGRTKFDGERAVQEAHSNAVVARTAWLYGPNGGSFPRTMIRAWEAGKTLRVVSDQIGCPTYTADLARVLVDLAEREPFPGVYHAAGSEATNWHSFAEVTIREWATLTGKPGPSPIEAIRTEDWPTPAVRPKYSVLSFEKVAGLGIAPMRPLQEAVADFCARLEGLGGP